VCARWQNQTLSQAWGRWYGEHAEQMRLGIIGARVVLRWGRLEIMRPFQGWQSRAAEKKRLERAANKVLMRWGNRSVFPSFNSWQAEYLEVRRRAAIAHKVVQRWSQMSMATALSRWVEKAEQQKALWDLTNRVLQRWTHRGLAEAWETWCCVLAEARRLARAFFKTALRWKNLMVGKCWNAWILFVQERQAAAQLEEDIRKSFARIDREFARTFARWLLVQWHLVSSSVLEAEHRVMGTSFARWRDAAARSARLQEIGNIISSNHTTRTKGRAYSFVLWGCVQFKNSYRMRVLGAYQRLRSRRLVGRCVLSWFYTVKAACEEEAHLEEEHQLYKSKALAHYLNEWRVIAVRQRDLRESASTIAQQWEREINLKRRLAAESGVAPETPDGKAGPTRYGQESKAHSPGGSSAVSQATKAMWGDIQVLPAGQQIVDTDLTIPSPGSFNDPDVTMIRPFGGARKALDVETAFRLWRKAAAAGQGQTKQAPAPAPSKPTIEVKPVTEAVPAADKTGPKRDAAPVTQTALKEEEKVHTKTKTAAATPAQAGTMRAALGASLSGASKEKKVGTQGVDVSRPTAPAKPEERAAATSPVPRLGLEKLAPKDEDTEAGSAPPAQQLPQAQATSSRFFGGIQDSFTGALSGLTGGAAQAQAPSGADSSQSSSSWLTGFMTTPKSAEQPAPEPPAKDKIAPPARVKNELVPSPRKIELTPAQKAAADAQIAAAAASKPSQSAASKPPMPRAPPTSGAKSDPSAFDALQPIDAEVGVGMRIQDDPPHRVIALVPGGPAARCGAIRVGDQLVAISDVEVATLAAAEIRSQIVGPDGSSVTLRLRRPASGAGNVPLKIPSNRANAKNSGGAGSRGGSAPSSASGTPVGTPREEYSVTVVREPAMKGALKAAAIQNKSVKELQAQFRKFDLNGSGRIDRVEMRKVLASIGFAASEAEVQRMINQSSPRATIDFPTFLTILGMSQRT